MHDKIKYSSLPNVRNLGMPLKMYQYSDIFEELQVSVYMHLLHNAI